MAAATRPILSLKTPVVSGQQDPAPLDIGVLDVLLPCRRFNIDHKVAVLGRVSLTTEFLLRLVKSADGISEDQAAGFFGFDQRDMAFVLTEADNLGYVERRDGRLWLTAEGMSLFRDGSLEPEIFEVEKRSLSVGFDLLSLAPQPPRPLDYFELKLPELSVADRELASEASRAIPQAFQRHYLEVGARDRSAQIKRALYSIDEVVAGARFSGIVRVNIRGTMDAPSAAEADLDDWRPDYERDDRKAIVQAAIRFVDDLKTSKSSDAEKAYGCLLDFAPEFLKDFARKDGLAIDRYYREARGRTGDLRSDRQTVPIVGSLMTRDNLRRLIEAIGLSRQAHDEVVSDVFWVAPNVPGWGATRILPDLLRQIKRMIGPDGVSPPSSHLFYSGRAAPHFSPAFGSCHGSDHPHVPRTLEVVLIPGVVAAVTVHEPLLTNFGHAVPLGILSYDPKVVGRVTSFISQHLHRYGSGAEYHRDNLLGVVAEPRAVPV